MASLNQQMLGKFHKKTFTHLVAFGIKPFFFQTEKRIGTWLLKGMHAYLFSANWPLQITLSVRPSSSVLATTWLLAFGSSELLLCLKYPIKSFILSLENCSLSLVKKVGWLINSLGFVFHLSDEGCYPVILTEILQKRKIKCFRKDCVVYYKLYPLHLNKFIIVGLGKLHK